MGLAALLQEKPFNDINGSGKHNNWSIATRDGVQLLAPNNINKASGNDASFGVIMSAIVSAVDKHGDLLRMAIASPGNDFRLGACEAPPAILSTYLGESMTNYLEAYKKGSTASYNPGSKTLDLGISCMPGLPLPSEDRNRTSPFPYGGHRFEFRAVGSSQNVSMVNTVLCTIFAESFGAFADAIEKGASPIDVAAKALDTHWKVIFNGNGYSEEWPIEAGKRGVTRIDSGVEAMKTLSDPENIALFEKMKVLSEKEAKARTLVMYDHYSGSVEMEALTMVDMINQHVIPSVKNADLPDSMVEGLEAAVASVSDGLKGMHAAEDEYTKAQLARVLRLETMEAARAVCDKVEEVVPADLWTLATYKELLFLDSHQGTEASLYD